MKPDMNKVNEITSRYILPTIEERTSYGYKRLDPYTKLFEERIIFLGQAIDDTVANDVSFIRHKDISNQRSNIFNLLPNSPKT